MDLWSILWLELWSGIAEGGGAEMEGGGGRNEQGGRGGGWVMRRDGVGGDVGATRGGGGGGRSVRGLFPAFTGPSLRSLLVQGSVRY